MASICICRVIFEDAVKKRKEHPDYSDSWEENWPKTLEGLSGRKRECGVCEDHLEGTPLPAIK